MRKQVIALAAAAIVMVAAVPGSAFAHECFNASRSEKGNAGASNSQRWLTIHTEEFFTDPEMGLTPAQIEDALEMLGESDIPESFTIFIGNHTIAEGTPSMTELGHASDGSGIDHIFAAHGDDLVGILCTVAPDHPFCAGGPPA